MKQLSTGAFVSLLLLSAISILAQSKDSSTAAKRKFKHDAEFVSSYDKSKDQTAVVMQLYDVEWPTGVDIFKRGTWIDRQDYRLDIQAAFVYSGRVITKPSTSLQFEIRVKHPGKASFIKSSMPELIADVDQDSISLGPTTLVSSKTFVPTDRPSQLSYEQVSAHFTYEGLIRLTNAKLVKMKVGDVEFTLKEYHLEALRDLGSRMVP